LFVHFTELKVKRVHVKDKEVLEDYLVLVADEQFVVKLVVESRNDVKVWLGRFRCCLGILRSLCAVFLEEEWA